MQDQRTGEGRHSVQRISIRGRGLDAAFLDFAAERARRFSLDGWAALPRAGEMTIVAAGPLALIDMLEVACMLGPIGALVEAVEREEEREDGAVGAGFRIVS